MIFINFIFIPAGKVPDKRHSKTIDDLIVVATHRNTMTVHGKPRKYLETWFVLVHNLGYQSTPGATKW